MGRKSLYESNVKPRLQAIREMAANGLTHVQIAQSLGINARSFERYLADEEDLKDAMNCGRQSAIKELENALFKSAVGINMKVTKGMKVKKVIYENGKKKGEVETVQPYEEEIYIAPNTQAAIFLLKNWSDDYSSDPQMLEIKKQELELKQNGAGNNEEESPIEWIFKDKKSVS